MVHSQFSDTPKDHVAHIRRGIAVSLDGSLSIVVYLQGRVPEIAKLVSTCHNHHGLWMLVVDMSRLKAINQQSEL